MPPSTAFRLVPCRFRHTAKVTGREGKNQHVKEELLTLFGHHKIRLRCTQLGLPRPLYNGLFPAFIDTVLSTPALVRRIHEHLEDGQQGLFKME